MELPSPAAGQGPAAAVASPDPLPPVVLSTHGLTKEFKGVRAVDGLELSVRRSDVFGFLGPNGAGKTTTIRMIVGLIYPTSGYAQVLDYRVPQQRREALRHIGGFVEIPAFYGNVSARRNLRLLGSLSGDLSEARVNEVLDIVGLRERADSKVADYSHGMKQRLGIAHALMQRPDLIILDEPTSGLDPQGMKDVRELVRELGKGGTTVFLSSHLLHEIEQVCNRAAIINRGRVVVQGPVRELRPTHEAVKILTSDQTRAREVLGALVGAQHVERDEEYLVVDSPDGATRGFVQALVQAGLGVDAVIPAREQGLEEYFLGLTQSGDIDPSPSGPQEGGAR
jgi:ABC-2 type transport system ATP-binding protein